MKKTKFLNPEKLLVDAGLRPGMTVADLGAGNGFFSLMAAHIVGGKGAVWAIDVLEEALSHIVSQAKLERSKNIRTLRCDLENLENSKIPDLSCDFIIIGKVLPQLRHPQALIRQIWRILKTGGLVLVVEWAPKNLAIGPAMELRQKPEQVQELFSKQALRFVRECETDPYHFAFVFQK